MSAEKLPAAWALGFASILLLVPPLFSSTALGHGPGPGTCGNEYSYKLVSMTVDSGTNTYDLFDNPGITFNGNNGQGYDITFTIHTSNQSASDNTEKGSIWYRNIAYGFGQGVCVYDVGPDEDKTVVVENIVPSQQFNKESADGNRDDLQYVEWNFMFTDPDAKTITYQVSWYSSSNYPAEDTGTSTVTIEAIYWNNTDFSNNRIRGMYTNLTQDGELIYEGFSPVTFTLNNTEEYQIGVADYGKYHFRGWGDAYEHGAIRTIEIQESTDIVLYVYYYDRGDAPTLQPPDDAQETPAKDDGSKNDDGGSDDEEDDNDRPAGTVLSPFVFKDKATSVQSEVDDQLLQEELSQEIADELQINGTLASYHFLNETGVQQLYILSGNWSMAMNDTAMTDFNADITMVRSDGTERQALSLGNMTMVDDSDMSLTSYTMSMISALDYDSNGSITKINVTITILKLNVITIELEDLATPIYGIVDKVVLVQDGQPTVMVRQFDMI